MVRFTHSKLQTPVLLDGSFMSCRGPASAGSRGTLRMNGVGEKRREKTREASLDRAKSEREGERE